MAEHSKRTRRRMPQAGMGGGLSVVPQIPIRLQGGLPDLPQAASCGGPVELLGHCAWASRSMMDRSDAHVSCRCLDQRHKCVLRNS